jgi:hypothetical protein
VLFYGSLSERRKAAILALKDAGLKVAAAFNAYGAERDAYIARAKVVLNLHYWEGNPFEALRVSYLLNNRACVVSEESDDPVFEDFRAGLAAAPYAGLVETCRRLVGDAARTSAPFGSGLQPPARPPQHVLLARALPNSPPASRRRARPTSSARSGGELAQHVVGRDTRKSPPPRRSAARRRPSRITMDSAASAGPWPNFEPSSSRPRALVKSPFAVGQQEDVLADAWSWAQAPITKTSLTDTQAMASTPRARNSCAFSLKPGRCLAEQSG